MRAVQAARKEEFIEISLVCGELPSVVTLDAAAVNAAEERILERYRVPRSCSEHFVHLVGGGGGGGGGEEKKKKKR